MMRGLWLCLPLLCTFAGAAVAEQRYFPLGFWDDAADASSDEQKVSFYEKWFSKHLTAMQESRLWIAKPQQNNVLSIRLLYLPTFDRPTMIRLIQDVSGQFRFVFKELDGKGGYEPGNLAKTIRGDVSARDVAELAALLDRIAPLTGKTPSDAVDTTMVCLDGTQTVLEFVDGKTYNAITRHQCQMPAGDDLRALILLLNKISGDRVIAPDTF